MSSVRETLLLESVAVAKQLITPEIIDRLKDINAMFSFYSEDNVEFCANNPGTLVPGRLYRDHKRNTRHMYGATGSTVHIATELSRILEQENGTWFGFNGHLPVLGVSQESLWGPRSLSSESIWGPKIMNGLTTPFFAIIPICTKEDSDARVFINRNFSQQVHEDTVLEYDVSERRYFNVSRGDVLFINPNDYAMGIECSTGVFNWLVLGTKAIT